MPHNIILDLEQHWQFLRYFKSLSCPWSVILVKSLFLYADLSGWKQSKVKRRRQTKKCTEGQGSSKQPPVCVRSLCKATLRPAGLTDGLHRSCAKCTSSIVRCASLCQVSPTWRLVPLYTATMWHLSIFMLEDLPSRLTMIVTNIKENTWFVGVQFPLIYVSLKWLGDLFGNNQMQIYAPCAPCHGSFGNICRLRSSSLKRMSALENQMTHSSSFCSNLNDCVWKQDKIVLAKSCFGNFLSRRDEPDWIVGRSTRRTSYTEYGTIIPQMEMT